MIMECEVEKIIVNQINTQKCVDFSAEDSIIIPDVKPDVLSIISSSGNVYVYKKELSNGRIKIDGGIQIDIIYLADNEVNNIRALHSTLDFSKVFEIDNAKENDIFSLELGVKSVDTKILNGRKVSIEATIEAKITVYSNEEKDIVKAISNQSNMQMISDSININSLRGCGETVSIAKDTISIDDNLADILNTRINVKNRETKISYNKVLSKADIALQIMYITEDEQIKKVTAEIPVMGFIDIQGVTDNEICDTIYQIRNIDIKPNNVENHSIGIEVEFLIICNAYENREINVIQDLYSPEENIIMEQENINLMQNKRNIIDSCDVQEKINVSNVKDNKIYDINIIPQIVKYNILNNSISYELELNIFMLFESNITNRIEENSQKISFTHVVNIENVNKNSVVETNIEIDSKDYVCTSEGSIDLNVGMKFMINTYFKNPIDVVCGLRSESIDDSTRNNSLVIYYVKNGDTLWKIAKKFRSTMDEIAKVNGIENEDKLSVGDQLFIPRYVI